MDYDLPADCIVDICRSGSNDAMVDFYLDKLNLMKIWSLKNCKSFVEEYGLKLEKPTKKTWFQYALWIEAWNQFEQRNEEE